MFREYFYGRQPIMSLRMQVILLCSLGNKNTLFHDPFYIQSNFDWICCVRTEGVCVCVCVCVCVSVCLSVCVCHLYSPNGWTDFDETFNKWSGGYLPVTFLTDFENSKWMTSWRPFYTFSIPALSRSQFCFDFLQNWAQGTKLSFKLCFWKSTKSVGNFRQY